MAEKWKENRRYPPHREHSRENPRDNNRDYYRDQRDYYRDGNKDHHEVQHGKEKNKVDMFIEKICHEENLQKRIQAAQQLRSHLQYLDYHSLPNFESFLSTLEPILKDGRFSKIFFFLYILFFFYIFFS